MSEYLDIRNWDGSLTGEKKERKKVHRDGDIHGTSHVWIFRRNEGTGSDDVLLQKRSARKDAFPGCFDTSSAGHIPAGGDFLESALRELEEELGIRAEPGDLRYVCMHRQTTDTKFYGERFYDREVSAVYIYVKDISETEFRLQKEEVESVCWMDYRECMELVRSRNENFCIPPEEYGQVCEYMEKEILGMKEKDREQEVKQEETGKKEISPTWNEDCLTELDEWIESQGIYLRQ